jgi:hypothetical protein
MVYTPNGSTAGIAKMRYKSILVSADAYLLQLLRYIHRNPVKSGLAANRRITPGAAIKLTCQRLKDGIG